MSDQNNIQDYQDEINKLKKENENLKSQLNYVLSKQSFVINLINKNENLKDEKNMLYNYLSKLNKK